jgi:putative transposase
MQLISFSPNQAILLFKQSYVVQGIENEKHITIRSDEGSTRTLEIETLFKHYLSGNLKANKAKSPKQGNKNPIKRVTRKLVSDYSESAQQSGKTSLSYLRAIVSSGLSLKPGAALDEVLAEVSKELGHSKPPSIATLRRWQAKLYRNGGDPTAAMPLYVLRGGPGKSRMSRQVENEMNAVIDNVYLTTEKKSIRTAYEELIRRLAEPSVWECPEMKAPPPSYSTFRRTLMARNQYEVTAARFGARAAERIFRSTNITTENFTFNECWEMDHTVLDLMVVDPKTKMARGRPRITVAVEYTTGSLMGFDIDFSGTSSQAVLNCLKHAISPKNYVEERYPDVQGKWPCHGVPMVIKLDNGIEFHSKSVRDACYELGIEMQFCPVAQAWYKGRVERFFRTLNESLLSTLPGYAGPDLIARNEIEDANLPVIDLDTLQRILHIWIIDVYMNMPRGGTV